MFVKLLHKIQKIISDFLKRTYLAFKNKDLNQVINSTLIISIILAIAFVILYKVAINIEATFWHTSYLVISNKIKNSLPQLYFFFLVVLAFFKWILNIRRFSTPNSELFEDTNTSSFKIKIHKKTFQISRGKLYGIALICIILLFFFIKIPSWDLSFTVNHPLKYSTYTEPALQMFKAKDPFVLQTHYMHNPITDSRGIGQNFGNLPILEWLLFSFYTIFSNILPLETITRLVMCLIGTGALIAIGQFFRIAFGNKTALIIVFLLAINQIFNLASFVTVYDTINIALTFFAFALILKFNNKEEYQKLFFAGLLLGIGAAIKENILLWAYPALCILFIKRGRPFSQYLSYFTSLAFISFLPIVLTKLTIDNFPTKAIIYFVLFVVGVMIIYLVKRFFSKICNLLEIVYRWILKLMNRHKILYVVPILLVIAVIKLLYMSDIADEFLTDWRLLFNIDLYIEFINSQAIPYSTIFVTILAFMAMVFLPMYERRDQKNKITIALVFGAIFYAILASKVLFFHSYYWLFIIITIMLLATKGLIILSKQFNSPLLSYSFLVVVLAALALPTISGTRSKLNRSVPSVYKVIDFINEQNLTDGTSFIDQGDLTYLTFKTNIYRVYDTSVFGDNEFKKYVAQNGFAQAMEHFKIKYLITSGGKLPDYLIFANSFSKEPLVNGSYRRTDIIYSQLYPTKFTYYPDLEIRQSILDANNVADQFYIVKDFTDYTIYGLTPACFNTIIE